MQLPDLIQTKSNNLGTIACQTKIKYHYFKSTRMEEERGKGRWFVKGVWTPMASLTLSCNGYLIFSLSPPVLDVSAFERLLGPCMDIMKRNTEEYEEQLVKVFGAKVTIILVF